MRNYQGLTEELLKKELKRNPVDSDQRLLVSLALLPADPSQAEFLRERLLVAKPTLFDLIVGKLEAYKPALIEGLWAVLEDRRNDSERRLRAAGALATYDPNNAKWGPVTRDVARAVVCTNPTFLEAWVAAFRPVSNRLLVPLGELFRDSQLDPLQRSVATALLAVYAKDDCDRLVDLLCDATEGQFPTIFRRCGHSRTRPFAAWRAYSARSLIRRPSRLRPSTIRKRY